MTRDQLGACIALDKDPDRRQVRLEWLDVSDAIPAPIPGLMLFSNRQESVLEIVQGDGTVVDLLAVLRAAEDVCRNWHKGSPKHIAHFVGDFGRLNKLAQAINGRKVLP